MSIETMFLIFFAILSTSFGIAYLAILNKLKQSNLALVETFIAKEAMQGILLEKKELVNNSDDILHKENFIKFLSDSRDWAFSYIEEVQDGLNKFVSDIEPEINYFKEYGDVGSMAPNYYSMKKITEAYEELKSLLPKEEEEVK
jgi:hypothetical protein